MVQDVSYTSRYRIMYLLSRYIVIILCYLKFRNLRPAAGEGSFFARTVARQFRATRAPCVNRSVPGRRSLSYPSSFLRQKRNFRERRAFSYALSPSLPLSFALSRYYLCEGIRRAKARTQGCVLDIPEPSLPEGPGIPPRVGGREIKRPSRREGGGRHMHNIARMENGARDDANRSIALDRAL